MRRLVKLLPVLLLTGCVGGMPKAPAPTNPVRFLSINDVSVADTLPDGNGSLARLATLKNRISAEGPVLFVLSGDFLSPSLLSRWYSGAQMVQALNASGLDYATFGNHEFDLPVDTLLARISESKFKWISSNCVQADGTRFPNVLPWDIVRVYGKRVGLFAVTMSSPDYPSYVRCTSPDSAAAEAIDSLNAMGADMIVALTHQPLAADEALLNREGQVELVLGGHERQAHTVAVGTRYVLKADANAVSTQFMTIWGTKSDWKSAPRLLDVRPSLPSDTTVQRVIDRWQDSIRVRLGPNYVVGTVVQPIDALDDAQRQQETGFGDLIADAVRMGTGADVGVVNAGALRLDQVLAPGSLWYYTVQLIFPYADETRIVTAPVSGQRLREILENGVSDRNLGSGGFLQVSGVRFTVDRSRPSGSRIGGPITTPNGNGIYADQVIQLSLPNYMACRGGDGYRVPEAAAACAAVRSAPRVVDLVVTHFSQRLGGRIEPPPGMRILMR